MKNNKKKSPMMKIVSAAAMLAVSASMLGTSTYAWFSMNKTVNVNGLKLNVKADSTYLIIGPENTAAGLQAENRKTYTFNSGNEMVVYPSAHKAVANTTDANTLGNWYFKYSDDPESSNVRVTEEKAIPSEKWLTDYVMHKEVYVVLAKNSQGATNLRCTGITFNEAPQDSATGDKLKYDGVTVLVTASAAKDEDDKGSNFTLAKTVLADTVDDTTPVKLDLWVYYNGNDTSVFTKNIPNLEGATIDVQFDVDYTPSA